MELRENMQNVDVDLEVGCKDGKFEMKLFRKLKRKALSFRHI